MDFIEPCFGIGHNLSLICQMTSENIKHQLIIIIIVSQTSTVVVIAVAAELLLLFLQVKLEKIQSERRLEAMWGVGPCKLGKLDLKLLTFCFVCASFDDVSIHCFSS